MENPQGYENLCQAVSNIREETVKELESWVSASRATRNTPINVRPDRGHADIERAVIGLGRRVGKRYHPEISALLSFLSLIRLLRSHAKSCSSGLCLLETADLLSSQKLEKTWHGVWRLSGHSDRVSALLRRMSADLDDRNGIEGQAALDRLLPHVDRIMTISVLGLLDMLRAGRLGCTCCSTECAEDCNRKRSWTSSQEHDVVRQLGIEDKWSSLYRAHSAGRDEILSSASTLTGLDAGTLVSEMEELEQKRNILRAQLRDEQVERAQLWYVDGLLLTRAWKTVSTLLLAALLTTVAAAAVLLVPRRGTWAESLYNLMYVPAGLILGVGPGVLRRGWQYHDLVRGRINVNKMSEVVNISYGAVTEARRMGFAVWGYYSCPYGALSNASVHGLEADIATRLSEVVDYEEVTAFFDNHRVNQVVVLRYGDKQVVLPLETEAGRENTYHVVTAKPTDTEALLPSSVMATWFTRHYGTAKVGM